MLSLGIKEGDPSLRMVFHRLLRYGSRVVADFFENKGYNLKIYIRSAGCIMFELWTGKHQANGLAHFNKAS